MPETFLFRLRVAAVFFFTISAIFWLLFGLWVYPWIVPADSVGSAGPSEQAGLAGGGLFVLSLLAIALAAGMFGRGSFAAPIAFLLGAGWIAATFWLYPNLAFGDMPYRLAFHLGGFVGLVASALAIASRGQRIPR